MSNNLKRNVFIDKGSMKRSWGHVVISFFLKIMCFPKWRTILAPWTTEPFEDALSLPNSDTLTQHYPVKCSRWFWNIPQLSHSLDVPDLQQVISSSLSQSWPLYKIWRSFLSYHKVPFCLPGLPYPLIPPLCLSDDTPTTNLNKAYSKLLLTLVILILLLEIIIIIIIIIWTQLMVKW